MRREPPPARSGEPPARPQRPGATPPQPPRAHPAEPRRGTPPAPAAGRQPRGADPTRKMDRPEPRQPLAYSQQPTVKNPRNEPPRNPRPPRRDQAPPPSPQRNAAPPQRPAPPPRDQRNPAAAQRNPAATRKYTEQDREGAPMLHAPTQQPVPYRENTPPPPPPPARPPKRTGGGGDRPRGSRRRFRLRWGRLILIILVLVLALPIAAAVYVDTHLVRIDALANYQGRPGDTPGTNWLLVGSDSRTGLTEEQEQELATGGEVGSERTDTIILVHVPESGTPTLVSLPRDSYVSVPGNGKDKLNSSFALGGPQLLVQTVEGATGLRIDHYAQIGFGGFADIVNAVGGIEMCLDEPISDPLAGIDLPAGCQQLNGAEALGFVRTRATPRADLDRMLNQRKFLSALLQKAASPSTLANPFRAWPLLQGLTKALEVDEGCHVWNLASLGRALGGDPIATTVPIGGFEDTDSGNVVLWDKEKASRFFQALADDEQIPSDLITTVGN
ncbi:LCP family protein [Nocardia sp. 2]|uniref:LCP family protein n=2 Tax=Nocardia acididurans TaxID=2802282 RepID=A0ABS1LYN5_9NOCA|nr:LCP family protein [Nocardia acididurans]